MPKFLPTPLPVTVVAVRPLTTPPTKSSSSSSSSAPIILGAANAGYTCVPNDFFDRVAVGLKESELRVMLYIYRHTLGYHKETDRISYEQFQNGVVSRRDGHRLDRGAGVCRRALVSALASLESQGLIVRDHVCGQHAPASYRIVIHQFSPQMVDNSSDSVQKNPYEGADQVIEMHAQELLQVQELPSTKQTLFHNNMKDSSRPGIALSEVVIMSGERGGEAEEGRGEEIVLEAHPEIPQTNSGYERARANSFSPPPPLPPLPKSSHFEAAVKVMQENVAGLSPHNARRLGEIALNQHGRDLAYIIRLVQHVTTSPAIRTPAAVLTALVRSNQERSSPLPGASGVTTTHQASYPQVTTPPRPALDLSKFAPGGKYAYLVCAASNDGS